MRAPSAVFATGAAINIIEMAKAANVFLGLVGSILMVAGGYYAFRLKKREWDNKKD